MKNKLIVVGLCIAFSMPLFAVSTQPKVTITSDKAIIENGRMIASGSAVATIGDMRVSCNEISFDKEKNVMKCSGPVTILTHGQTLTATNVTIFTLEERIVADTVRMDATRWENTHP